MPLVFRALQGDPTVTELVLHDTDPLRLRVVAKILAEQAAGGPRGPRVRVETDLDTALRAADFVFSAMRVGGTEGRVRDEHIPLAEGVLGQETVGAGGVLYGLRTIPVALHVAERVRAVAPSAWVINFTNPAGMVTEAMARVLGPRVIGICDSPVGLVRRAARAAGADPDAPGFSYDYVGLNHLGWLRGLAADGRELLPGLLADPAALGSFEEGRLFGAEWLSALGSVPNEYLHYYYFRREALAAVRSADATRGEFLHRRQSEFFAAADRARGAGEGAAGESGGAGAGAEAGAGNGNGAGSDGGPSAYGLWDRARLEREETYMAENRAATGGWQRDPHDLDGGGYDKVALALMRAIARDERTVLILNVPGGGAVPLLDPDAVVEVPCEVGAFGARPIPVAAPDEHQAGLMLALKSVERAAIEAATTGSRAAALRALVRHPLVDSAAAASRILTAAKW